MKNARRAIALLLTLSSLLGSSSLLGFSCVSTPLQTNADLDSWTRDNYGSALEVVFGNPCATPTDSRWTVCIRIVPGHPQDLEYSLLVQKRHDGAVFARVVRPKLQSIHTQLYEQRKGDHTASIGELARRVELESQEGDSRKFSYLPALADAFEKIRFSPVPSDETIMDATEYRFTVRSSSGDQADLVLSGPGSTAPHQPQPLIEWAESARKMLVRAFP